MNDDFNRFCSSINTSDFNEPKTEKKKKMPKIALVLGLIIASFWTAYALDYLFSPDDPIKITAYQLTENCHTEIMLNTDTGNVVQLELDCTSDVDLEEMNEALPALKQKASELGYKINIPFISSQLVEKFQNDDTENIDGTGNI